MYVKESGSLWTLNQYLIIPFCLNKFKGYSFASTNKLDIGEDLKAPVAILIPAWCTAFRRSSFDCFADEYTTDPYDWLINWFMQFLALSQAPEPSGHSAHIYKFLKLLYMKTKNKIKYIKPYKTHKTTIIFIHTYRSGKQSVAIHT